MKKIALLSVSALMMGPVAQSDCSNSSSSGYTYVRHSCQTSSGQCEFMDRSLFTGSLAVFVSNVVYDDRDRYVNSEFFDETQIQLGRSLLGSSAFCHASYGDAQDARRSFIADRTRQGYQIIYVQMDDY